MWRVVSVGISPDFLNLYAILFFFAGILELLNALLNKLKVFLI